MEKSISKKSPHLAKGNVASLLAAEGERAESRCCKGFCGSRNRDYVDLELLEILNEKKRRKSIASIKDEEITNKIFKNKKDGCSESGYFRLQYISEPQYTMEGLRKQCKATRKLPSPLEAIRQSNLREPGNWQKSTKSQGTESETQISEINQMLQRRLSGIITMSKDGPGEAGEALVTYETMRSNARVDTVSTLVDSVDSRRMSYSSSEYNLSPRRSSFVLRNASLSVVPSHYTVSTGQIQEKLEERSDSDFINRLPEISTQVKSELERNIIYTRRYLKVLKKAMKQAEFSAEKVKCPVATAVSPVILSSMFVAVTCSIIVTITHYIYIIHCSEHR